MPAPVRRIALALLSFALAFVAARLRLSYADPLAKAAEAAMYSTDSSLPVALYSEALRRDDASPYRWADLAEALAANGRIADAQRCFERALVLAPGVPQIWVRHANFCFLHDQPAPALQSAARVLDCVPDYDSVLFHDFDQMLSRPAEIDAALAHSPRALRSWLGHLIAINEPAAARLAWTQIMSAGDGEAAIASAYTDYLIRNQSWPEAIAAWSQWLGPRRGDYPGRNLLFNGRFDQAPSRGSLDWRVGENSEFFETVREAPGMRIHFEGKANLDYNQLSQIAVLPAPGHYRLSARVRSDGLTTNEGPRLAITDLGLETESVTGTHDWMPLTIEFSTAKARAIRVAVIRRPSLKFDNKIAGTFWVSDVTLAPLFRPSGL
jgi:tetratricopeptide (TPR) repeat protein